MTATRTMRKPTANGTAPVRLTKAEEERITHRVESESMALLEAHSWAEDILPPLVEACESSMEELRSAATGGVPDFTRAEFLMLLRYLGEASSALREAADIIAGAGKDGAK